MKLTKEQETQLTELAFAEYSNKQIAEQMDLKITDVHAARSRLGITIPKVLAAKGVQPVADQKVKRTAEEITTEITKVEKAKEVAEKKIDRCMERLEELYTELVNAHDNNKQN